MTLEPALFEVKRKDGQTVFAVCPDAVNVYVPNGLKSSERRLRCWRVRPGKRLYVREYLGVTPDSVRVYIDNTRPRDQKVVSLLAGLIMPRVAYFPITS
ncbi:MAG: hypothetical protein U0X39_02180 [Bacteroidales bacterium]